MTVPILDLTDRTNMFYWQTNRRITAEQQKDIFLTRHARLNDALLLLAVSAGMKKAGFSGDDTIVAASDPILALGSVNTAVPIRLKSGRTIVIRMHPPEVKNGYFWVEALATKLAKASGVPTYATIVVDDTRGDVPFDYMIMTREKGKSIQELLPMPMNLEETLVIQTGRYAALIHSVKPEGFGFFRNDIAKKEGKLVGQYDALEEHIHAALAEDLAFLVDTQTILFAQSKTIELLFHRHASLFTGATPVLIHNDIADWNQLTDGKQITGMMDWDECVGGDPIMELAAYNLFYGERRMRWFVRGYEEVKKLGDWKEKLELYKLRYLVSKLHLRKKRSRVEDSEFLRGNLTRGLEALQEVFTYFDV
ncbi:MAG: aminoglycoside phosphotransferase family protein [Candidatus Gottesmanbacteria bacterium]|nr:aminoglycoside phosphotransferase family protein [Candidatus Gottesmanbacteria bacterium]